MLFFSRMFTAFAPNSDWLYFLRNYGITMVLGIILSTPVLKPFYNLCVRKEWLGVLVFGAITVMSVAYLVDATYNPFLYFRF